VAKGSDDPANPTQPGWYPDPWSATGEGERYYDGKRWGTTDRPMGRHTVVTKEPGDDPGPGRFRRLVVPIGVLVLLVGAYFAVSRLTGSSSDDTAAPEREQSTHDRPPPSREAATEPLGTPGPVPTGDGEFEFLDVQPSDRSKPVAWDPCRPIHYVVNPDGQPAGASEAIAAAVAKVSAATGLQFVDDGSTTEVPTKRREPYQPKRYGKDRWAPVLIAWSDETVEPELGGGTDGFAGPQGIDAPDGTAVYVTGDVVLDRVDLADAGADVEPTVLHELGHLVGLDHTSDRRQLMFAEGQDGVTAYADGDLRGLAALGRGKCVPDV
jgi:hypothetical protein